MDPYFESGLNPEALTNWIHDVRNSLINLDARSSNSVFNAATALNYLKNKIITSEFKSLSKYTIGQQDRAILKEQQIVKDVAKIVKDDSIEKSKTIDTDIKTKQDASKAAIKKIIDPKVEEAKFKDLIADLSSSVDSGEQYGYAQAKDIDNTDNKLIVSSTGKHVSATGARFPTVNEVYPSPTKGITRTLNNKLDFSGDENGMFKSWIKLDASGKKRVANTSQTGTPDEPLSAKTSKIQKDLKDNQLPGSYKFFIEKLHGRTSDGNPYKKNPVTNSTKGKKIPKDYANRMLFSAYIEDYNDDYNVNKQDYNFIGRAEGVPYYKDTKRKLTLSFNILADYSLEYMSASKVLHDQLQLIDGKNFNDQLKFLIDSFPDWGKGHIGLPTTDANGNKVGGHVPGLYSDTPESLWYKINFLSQCCYPYYRTDGKMKEQPMIRLRIADFYDVMGMLNSISFDLKPFEDIIIDMNPSTIGNIPMAIKVTMSMDIYHDHEPSSIYFGFYNRKEFDLDESKKVTGEGIALTTDNLKTNSPLSIVNNIQNESIFDIPQVLDTDNFKKLKNSLKDNFKKLKSGFKQLEEQVGIKTKDATLKDATKKSIESYNKINEIVEVLRIEQGYGASTAAAPSLASLKGRGTPDINIGKAAGLDNHKSLEDRVKQAKTFVKKIQSDVKQYQSSYEELEGQVVNQIQNVTSTIRDANESLTKAGINLGEIQAVRDISDGINKVKPSNLIPKTLGDIIDNVKRNNS